MPLMSWQLWLAKDLVEDHRLPWQKPQTNLTPERVAQSIFSLLIEICSRFFISAIFKKLDCFLVNLFSLNYRTNLLTRKKISV